MSVEIVVPALGESVTEATVAQWLKKVGDQVSRDEPLVELETDKVTLEVNAAAPGVLSEILVPAGENVAVGAVLGTIGDGAGAAARKAEPPAKPAPAQQPATGSRPDRVPTATAVTAEPPPPPAEAGEEPAILPAARKLIEERRIDPSNLRGTGKGGRITKEDVLAYLETGAAAVEQPAPRLEPLPGAPAPEPQRAPAARTPEPAAPTTIEIPAFTRPAGAERPRAEREERVRMTKLRKTIATRLKQAQNTAAMLTTFNEVDMSVLIAVRSEYRDSFEKKHGVRLGFMSFFVKACITALKEIPAVNGEIDGDELVYKNYYDIGVAVGTPQGLVVPVVRDADRLSFAEVEQTINDLGRRARDGKLSMAELTGGTFTISNGGVYGSLMSTPILNPPQSGILGMHKIQDRPMVADGKIEPRPMMYLALSYDHRIVDGREAVTFLVRVKECIEDPKRILLDV